MACYDVFNGDADGICALQQLRLWSPKEAVLITGLKRDIGLLKRVQAQPGDEVTVLDISLDKNSDALENVLSAGARVFYADHHFPGDLPDHENLDLHIDPAADTCTSLLLTIILMAPGHGGRSSEHLATISTPQLKCWVSQQD